MRAGTTLALGFASVLCIAASDCEDSTGPNAALRQDLDAARARWQAQGYVDYELTLQRDCFCGEDYRGPVVVSVRGGQVVGRTYQESGEPVSAEIAPYFPDVLGLFGFLEESLDENPAEARAEFHSELGYPTNVWIDFRANVADEEQGFTTLSLEPSGD